MLPITGNNLDADLGQMLLPLTLMPCPLLCFLEFVDLNGLSDTLHMIGFIRINLVFLKSISLNVISQKLSE